MAEPNARIKTISTLLPEFSFSKKKQLAFYKKWISSQNKKFREKAMDIFKNANVKNKNSIASEDVVLSDRTFEESNNLYRKKAVELGTKCLEQALKKSKTKPEEIDFLITTSCTGLMIPSFGAFVINNLGLRNDIKLLPINEAGCAAGVLALSYAADFLKAYPESIVAVVTLEFATNTMQRNDFSTENVIGVALFGDGVACAILDTKSNGPEILDAKMYHHPNSTDILGYNITNTGLRMNLDKSIPVVIRNNFEKIVAPFLEDNNLSIKNTNHFLVHPGGIKILENIEDILRRFGKNVDVSRKVMEQHGNISSSTILFIINEYLKKNIKNEVACVLSFGPGFAAHQLLLKWE